MKLTEDQKSELKADIASGSLSNFALSGKYDVDLSTIQKYKNPERFKSRSRQRNKSSVTNIKGEQTHG